MEGELSGVRKKRKSREGARAEKKAQFGTSSAADMTGDKG